jgi:hypothetical protein
MLLGDCRMPSDLPPSPRPWLATLTADLNSSFSTPHSPLCTQQPLPKKAVTPSQMLSIRHLTRHKNRHKPVTHTSQNPPVRHLVHSRFDEGGSRRGEGGWFAAKKHKEHPGLFVTYLSGSYQLGRTVPPSPVIQTGPKLTRGNPFLEPPAI